jgi:hypothetical protein
MKLAWKLLFLVDIDENIVICKKYAHFKTKLACKSYVRVVNKGIILLTQRNFTYVKGGEAVPTKHMFTPLAHHLGTSLVFFDGNFAHRAVLDALWVENQGTLASVLIEICQK